MKPDRGIDLFRIAGIQIATDYSRTGITRFIQLKAEIEGEEQALLP